MDVCDKIFHTLTGIRTPDRPACDVITVQTALSGLQISTSVGSVSQVLLTSPQFEFHV